MKSFSELTSASQVNNDDLLAISQTSGSGYASKKTTVKDITDKSNLNLAEEYDSTSTYAVDDYVIYESVLYKCIATTTGTFDSTKWTSVVVTDEMGSGGGSGTGGHTIIDENGNSMTARAGLQFVGGANVSDDATNNKTIVDLASAGGIDGVFIDADNVIETLVGNGDMKTYTATEDCIVAGTLVGTSGNSPALLIDGVTVTYIDTNNTIGAFLYLKKGQVLSYRMASSGTNLKVYGIQTGTTHSKFQPVIYSLEEREIGVWKDGKPLYEKTIDFGAIPNSTSKSVAHNISNLDKIVSFDGVMISSDSFETLPSGENSNFRLTANDTNINVVTSANWNDWSSSFITIRYTKTTDVAGSGSWTPQGVPTYHYSTDEHIVGTYFGESLYEKSIRNVSITSNTQWIDTGLDIGDSIVKSEGVLLQTNGDILTLSSGDSGANAGINYFAKGVVTQGKWSCFFRTSNNDARGNLTLTLQYTKTS